MSLPEEAHPLPFRPKTDRSWTGKHEHAHLSGELACADEETFRTMVRALLRLLCTKPGAPIHPAPFLSPNGDDLLLEAAAPYPLYAQLLIFREPPATLGEPQLQRVRAAIGRFLESGLEVDTYLLIHNSDLRNPEFRAGLQAETLQLVKSGKAERAEVWDRQHLLRQVFGAMADHVLVAAEAGGLSRVRLEELLQTREGAPLEVVPMRTSLLATDQYRLRSMGDPGPETASDPAIAILQGEDTNLTLLLGSFGFGKTTAVARSLNQWSHHVLYVPGASISETVVGTKDLLSRCVSMDELFRGCPAEDRALYELIARPAVEHLFRKDDKTPLAIVIDGLDESPFLGRQGGLQQLFNCLRIVSVPVVLAMRTEFWNDRRQEFETTVGLIARQGPVRPRTIRAVELLPWQDEQVLLFVRRAREVWENAQQRSRIARLETLVENGGYGAIYGDIPRRPLFLRLIVESVAEAGLPGERIGRARLFRDWAQWKIRRDVVEVRAQGGARPHLLSERESLEDVVSVAWEAMLQAAALMTQEHEGTLELTPDCLLDEVLSAAPRLQRIEDELALHHQSLLMPVGERRGDRLSRISFAHRAFQEFFLAWFLLQQRRLGETPALPEAVTDWVQDLQNEGLVEGRLLQDRPLRPSIPPPRPLGPSPPASRHADLELLVQERPGSGRKTFDFLLSAHDPELGLNRKSFGSVTLEREPAELFKQHLGDLGKLAISAEELEEKGAFLSEKILPPELRRYLTGLQETATTLMVQSDEPWIPWELLRLGSSEEADGPFLCDAFAITRWLQGIRLTTWLPLRRMAVIAPRDSGLARTEQEWERLHGLRQPDREVERLPARLAPLREAFRKGEHDGWHFIGHGSYRENAPDLSGIVLEEGEVLTPEHLSGSSKRMGNKRPLVFLNACSSGRSGVSLTGLGGWAPHFIGAGAGAFISALWPIGDQHGTDFVVAFYEAFRGGASLSEAVRTARRKIRSGDPTWLGYTVYGHPLATCMGTVTRTNPLRRSRMLKLLSLAANPVVLFPQDAPPAPQSAERELTDALARWRSTVLTADEWRPARLLVEYERDQPSIDLYQELALERLDGPQAAWLGHGGEAAEYTTLKSPENMLMAASARSLITSLEDRSIIIGTPGAGKTSLAKWLLRTIETQQAPDYAHALFVSLHEYAMDLERLPNLGILEHFLLRRADVTLANAPALVGALSALDWAATDGRVMVILDGWDEVPAGARSIVKASIDRELGGIRTVVTSRPAGYPGVLATRNSRLYRIFPLTMRAIRALVSAYAKARQHPDAARTILTIIGHNTPLHELASNPYLLMAVCEVLFSHMSLPADVRITQTWILQELVQVIVRNHNEMRAEAPLADDDLSSLQELAFGFSLQGESKQIFGPAPLRMRQNAAITTSRFVNQVTTQAGYFEFTHLRLQEFFAAWRLAGLPRDAQSTFTRARALTQQWEEEAGFFAGFQASEPSEAEPWYTLASHVEWARAEKAGLALQRLGNLVAAAGIGILDGGKRLLQYDLRELLFGRLIRGDGLAADTMTVLLRLDARYVIRRMQQLDVSDEIWERVYRVIPLYVRDATGLATWLAERPNLAWLLRVPGFGFRDEAELAKLRTAAQNPSTSVRERADAIFDLGIAADTEAIGLLAALLRASTPLTRPAAHALAQIGGVQAAGALVDVLVAPDPNLSLRDRQAVADSLMIGRFGALEPVSRDRLMAWLRTNRAVLPAGYATALRALNHARLPWGGDVILSLIVDSGVPSEIREGALHLLPGVADERVLADVAAFAWGTTDEVLQRNIWSSLPFLPLWSPIFVELRRSGTDDMDLIGLVGRTRGRYPNAELLSDFPDQLCDLIRQAWKNGWTKVCEGLWRIAERERHDAFELLALEMVVDPASGLHERLAAVEFLKQSQQPIADDHARALVIAGLAAPSIIRDQMIEAVVHIVAAKRQQLIPWLLKALAMATPPLENGQVEAFSRSALEQAASHGWLIFEDAVVDPTGRRHKA